MDLIEVDAASRTKVEDTRDLLDNVQYAPNQGRYKIYLIDEVHMLSGHSFNALLKTLEEPPAHVKFLLATTDPHKIPVTVLSRCLQFNLKRLLPEQINQQLQFILEQEAISFESPALKMIARAADGSLRDALSLLDQAIVYGSGQVNTEAVTGMLGSVAQQPIHEVLEALATGDTQTLLNKIASLAELTPDYADILQQVLQVLHRVAINQQSAQFTDAEFDADLISNLSKSISPEDVQLYYQIGLIGLRDLALAPDPRSGFEMVMLRMLVFRPQSSTQSQSQPKLAPVKTSPATTVIKPTQPTIAAEPPQTTHAPASSEWPEIIRAINISGRTKELANNCVLDSIDGNTCRLLLDPKFQQVGTKAEENLKAALEKYYGKSLKLVISTQATPQMTPALEIQQARENQQQNAVDAINTDPNINSLKESFGARIMPGSIEPIN
jgi:DNA polymerase-3 subunit gamma/tau